MPKTYSPGEIEPHIYARWEAADYFAPRAARTGVSPATAEPTEAGESHYCIVIPPPNVTGTLHMGHAFQDTIMDALTRNHRMRGQRTLWQPGTDHAGIATQMVVERQLEGEGIRRTQLTREAFVERVWAWKEHSGGTIGRQMRRLGASVDWSRERFTMDAGLSRAVVEAFVRLHERGLIYRGKRLVNWDPKLLTALSDLEVLSSEEQGSLWHLRYPLVPEGGNGKGVAAPEYLVVATTRPETMLGDTAVAVNPHDERYRALIGRHVRLPLTGREIPIIADDYVDPAFGSGCVKITPAHDFNDYAIGRRHNLPLINVFAPDARLNDEAPEALRGLPRFTARERIIEQLAAQELVERIEPHKLMIPRGDRSGEVIEPYLTDQWYVSVAELAGPAIAAVESGRVRFVPDNWSKTYFQWMHNIQDWCISRQLWWGHRIPAWYDDANNIYVARSAEDASAQARARHGRDVPLRQDDDVLDTWFSAGLWPFSTLGWPDATPELATFYPTDVLVTGFDIIFFWVARMIMMGLAFMDEVPFREVYVHGLIRDAEGQKMSKSKGNVIDPIDVIDGIELPALLAKRTAGLMQPHLAAGIERATRKQFPNGIPAHGTDALRFTFAQLATQSRDLRFDLARVDANRKFCNKLWQVARFALGALSAAVDEAPQAAAASAAATPMYSAADRWIRSRLGATIEAVDQAVADYRFDMAASALYEFTWNELCDWYVEIVKPALRPEAQADARAAARATLGSVFETLLRLLHPLMPFITEEIWQRLAPLVRVTGNTITLAPWPRAADFPRDADADAEIGWLRGVVEGARQIKGEMDIAMRRVPLLLADASQSDLERLRRHGALLSHLAALTEIRVLAQGEAPPPAASAIVGELTLLVPMAGLIEPASELARLEKLVQKNRQELARARAKLGKQEFVDNAPGEVVAQERARLADFERRETGLARQMQQVRALAQQGEPGERRGGGGGGGATRASAEGAP
ncbi:MAG TPA: valine--tRNA ligase [Steroidobacteraceae bacterium]|jgi:valyl-tRNA synthetase|nr:valine--tRNA ligase [Steroidobacteraceae bacterium]